MLPAKHTAGLASCKYLIVLHRTVKCAQLRVCIVAVKYGISQLFVTGNRSQTLEFWSIGFSQFQVSGLWGLFSPTRLKTFEVDMNNCCKEKKFWACPLKRTKFTILTMSRHYTEELISNSSTISLLRLISSLQVFKDGNITLSRAIAPRKRIASQYYTGDHACSLQCLRRSEVWNPCTMQVSSQQRHCSFSISSYHAPLCKLLAVVSRFKCL